MYPHPPAHEHICLSISERPHNIFFYTKSRQLELLWKWKKPQGSLRQRQAYDPFRLRNFNAEVNRACCPIDKMDIFNIPELYEYSRMYNISWLHSASFIARVPTFARPTRGGSGGKPKNCQEILNANSKAKSGKYTIYPTSSMSVTTYCSMEGKMGWTKVYIYIYSIYICYMLYLLYMYTLVRAGGS